MSEKQEERLLEIADKYVNAMNKLKDKYKFSDDLAFQIIKLSEINLMLSVINKSLKNVYTAIAMLRKK